MTDAERLERAVWKLSQAGYAVRLDSAGRYIVRAANRDYDTATVAGLAGLATLADVIYADHWTQRKITPSA
jgi:hypothetical protein